MVNHHTQAIHTMISRLIPGFAMLAAPNMLFAASEDPTQSFDEAWSLVSLYENKSNPVIQRLAFTGRAHLDFAIIEGKGDPAAGFTDRDLSFDFGGWRRLRGGFDATVFNDFTLHAEADFNPDEDPVYRKLTNIYVGWKPCVGAEIKVGKQSMGFTLDGTTSSNELITIDRNNLSNNLWFTNEHIPGISVEGTHAHWLYTLGVFSQGGANNEFGDFDQGTAWLASVGYDLADKLDLDAAIVRFDYVFNEETTATDMFTNRNFGNIVSLSGSFEQEDLGLRADLSYGDGFLGQSDIWGLVVMPYYNFTDKLQGVFRYTFIGSDGNNGVRFARYESETMESGLGDQYQEAYLGLNYYLYGHKLKLQTGFQYVSMRDQADDGGAFDGFAWTTGIRLSW